jgi:competence protein ComFC
MITQGGNKKHLTALLDYFLPRFCVSCAFKLQLNEDTICNNCLNQIEKTSPERIKNEFERKFKDSEIVSDFFPLYIFEKDKELQHAIHTLKYENKFKVGIFLGKLLGIELKKARPRWQIDIIIPIPLHQLKKAERGFNQSLYAAKGVNSVLNKLLKENIVKRVIYTESQTTMNLSERKENIFGAFKIRKQKIIEGKNILLIDDVITTGATISECGMVLIESGANSIYAASIAIAD